MNESNSHSFLEFGSYNEATKTRKVYDSRTHQQAYDWLMHSRYSNDIYTYHLMSQHYSLNDIFKALETYQQVHHRDDIVFNFNKLIALSLTQNSYYELGQTLFGCIDAMVLCQQISRHIGFYFPKNVNLKEIAWYGFDISEFFNFFATKMHGDYQIQTSSKANELPDSLGCAFAKGITLLYAIRTAEQLFEFMAKGEITLFDYSISLNEELDTQIGTGLGVRYISKEDFDDCYQKILKQGRDIWIRGNHKVNDKGQFYFEGFCTTPALADTFIKSQNALHTCLNEMPDVNSALVHELSDDYWHWSSLSDVLDRLE
ncbi:hypothetical protein K6Y31_12185 [Motilimonas cestriensis]|uniref:Uncharacterized protein n=1 Tax=Motilimonas cestriensis TaxID=2742685 RepID=A0ABS8WDE8_9GAMM|nr:hypothetical protein [Motilimonas cestriensis]MCE2595579.1 hypothetical protein [Motilimonas cestriensis]